MKTIFLIYILLLTSFSAVGQSEENREITKSQKKNAIYPTVGTLLVFSWYITFNGSYERRIVRFDSSFVHSIWIKAGFGKWVDFYDESTNGLYYLAGVTILAFRGSSHVELNLYAPQYGDFEFPDTSRPVPGVAIGYRFQKDSGGIIGRIGFGYPELAYLSLGYCF